MNKEEANDMLFKVKTAEDVEKALKAGADLEAKDKFRMTVLINAAWKGNVEVVNALIEAGANSKAKNKHDMTALMYAATVEVVEALAKAGVDVNAKDEEGMTALIHAARKGNVGVVNALIEAGADLEAKDEITGSTALLWADTVEVVEALAKAGANLEAKDKSGNTALLHAVECGKIGVVKALVEAGADRKGVEKEVKKMLILDTRNKYRVQDNKLGEARLKVAASMGLEEVKLPKKLKKVETKVNDALFKKKDKSK